MDRKIVMIKNFRLYLLKQVDGLTTQQLNHIPSGYSNNIIWHLGHLICVVQNMCYARSGLPVTVEDKYISPYLPGTKPEKSVDEEDIRRIKELLITSIDRLQSDLDKHIFVNYTPSAMIPKVYGFEVNGIDEALAYLLQHEGFHQGYVVSMKRLV